MIARSDFNDPSLYDLACTHRSISGTHNNQRLEFLGDRVLGLVIAHMLYEHFPDEREGDMAIRHAALVCAEALSAVAEKLELGKYMLVADGKYHSCGRTNNSNLADMAEALIGALYIDSGLERAREFIVQYWTPLLLEDIKPPKDHKTMLQEWVQAQGLPLPEYVEVMRTGPSHAPEFTIEVRVLGYPRKCAIATSKRDAQQQAAEALLRSEGVLSS
jgi:ribonuclease III